MNMNIMTLQERVHRRSGHVAVTYGDSLLVWGGFMETPSGLSDVLHTNDPCVYHFTDEIWVYHHDTELWKRLLTSGDIPPPTCGSCGVVLNDSLYVFGGFSHSDNLLGNSNRLYRLDLKKLQWHLLNPEGQPPTACDKLTGWMYGERVYFFGGFGPTPNFYPSFNFEIDPSTQQSSEPRGWNNQLIAYEPRTNTWVWQKVNGEPPCPRAAHAADITGHKVYIFGGRFMNTRRNDVHCLDLSTMTWSTVSLCSDTSNQVPPGRSWHSFTFITPTKAILYGGLSNYNIVLNDCWSFDVQQKLWTPIFRQNTWQEDDEDNVKLDTFRSGRFWHRAVASPWKELLCVVGGTVAQLNKIQNSRDHAEELLVLEFTPKSLFRLSLDVILVNVPVHHWFEQHLLPHEVENILLLRLEQNPTLPSL